MKLLLLLLDLFIVYLLVRHFWRARRRGGRRDVARAGEMVRCAHCGLFLPRGEALAADGRFYCGGAHRREARADEGNGRG